MPHPALASCQKAFGLLARASHSPGDVAHFLRRHWRNLAPLTCASVLRPPGPSTFWAVPIIDSGNFQWRERGRLHGSIAAGWVEGLGSTGVR